MPAHIDEDEPDENNGRMSPQRSASGTEPESNTPTVTPDLIYQLAVGFMASKSLFIANKVGLFESLDNGPITLEEAAKRVNLPRRSTAILIDSMTAVGLIENVGNSFQNSPIATRYLGNRPLVDLRPFLRFWDDLSYPGWTDFERALRDGPSDLLDTQKDEHALIQCVEAFSRGTADSLATTYDFGPHNRVLDLGGGAGVFLETLLLRYPHLRCTLFDLMITGATTKERFTDTEIGEKITVVAGNFFSDTLPVGHDAILLCNVIDLFVPKKIVELLSRIRDQVPRGTRLLILDVLWTTESHTSPIFTTLMVGEYLLLSRDGRIYCVDEVRQWLKSSGWFFVGQQELVGPTNLIVAEAAQ
jgi:O-methyltransferase/methyltransferase family protein